MAQTAPIDQVTANRLVFEESTEVPAPVSEVYRRWTDFTHFPEFMSHVQEVRPLGGDRYHWVARIFGTKQEWDTEVTDREPLRRVAWRSLTGPYNAGIVSFSELPNNKTEMRVRMEYTPPGGQTGQKLERLTHATRRVIKEDLNNFKRTVTGGRALTGEPQTPEGFGRVMALLGIPVATGLIAGTTAWFFEPNLLRSRAARRTTQPFRQFQQFQQFTYPVTPTTSAVSWFWAFLGWCSIIGAAFLRARGRRNDALFVGEWVPTFLGLGILSRFIGRRRAMPHPAANAGSYALAGASLGALITAMVTYLRGKRSDGLFIGQWAPSFLGLALLMRLLRRW
jgi:uncharacterized membrane protein